MFNELQALPAYPVLDYWGHFFLSSLICFCFKNVTSISKLSNSIHLPWAFQINYGFSRTVLPCLCFCASLGVAVVADQCPTSVSLSAIITAVNAWMAAWLTIAWMPSDSTISAWFRIFHLGCICMLLWNDFVCIFTSVHQVRISPVHPITSTQMHSGHA